MAWEFRQWRRQWLHWALFVLGFAVLAGSYGVAVRQVQQASTQEYNTLLDESDRLVDADKQLAKKDQTAAVKTQRQAVARAQRVVTAYGRALKNRQDPLLARRLAYFRLLQKPGVPFSQRSPQAIHTAIVRDRYLTAQHLTPRENAATLTPAAFFVASQNVVVFLAFLVIVILQTANLFGSDWEQGSIRLLLTLPGVRRQLRWHKLRLAALISGAEAACWALTGYAGSAVLSRTLWGGRYPWHVAGSRVVTLTPVFWSNAATMVLLTAAVLLLLDWLSVLSRDRFTAVAATVAILVSGALFFGAAADQWLAALNPFYQLGLTAHIAARALGPYTGTALGVDAALVMILALLGGRTAQRAAQHF
ncbi:ABC transporter permease subunit [Schleiferilactobacillus shenzhenensis]|nr:ABC transporter permease subunit [Schleiferilactobacillus shenzhenensis]